MRRHGLLKVALKFTGAALVSAALLPGAPLFRFVHHAEEVWVDGWLHGVVSDTEDAGRLYRLRAERRDGIFQGIVLEPRQGREYRPVRLHRIGLPPLPSGVGKLI